LLIDAILIPQFNEKVPFTKNVEKWHMIQQRTKRVVCMVFGIIHNLASLGYSSTHDPGIAITTVSVVCR